MKFHSTYYQHQLSFFVRINLTKNTVIVGIEPTGSKTRSLAESLELPTFKYHQRYRQESNLHVQRTQAFKASGETNNPNGSSDSNRNRTYTLIEFPFRIGMDYQLSSTVKHHVRLHSRNDVITFLIKNVIKKYDSSRNLTYGARDPRLSKTLRIIQHSNTIKASSKN